MVHRAPDEYWYDKLCRTIAGLNDEMQSIESEIVATRAIRANGGDDDEHDPDGIPLSSALQILEGQLVRAVARSREARGALVDMESGRYGICRRCAQLIPASRLEIRPAATTCTACVGSGSYP